MEDANDTMLEAAVTSASVSHTARRAVGPRPVSHTARRPRPVSHTARRPRPVSHTARRAVGPKTLMVVLYPEALRHRCRR
jgi:hypothetical protein